jgi:hypothetical protein
VDKAGGSIIVYNAGKHVKSLFNPGDTLQASLFFFLFFFFFFLRVCVALVKGSLFVFWTRQVCLYMVNLALQNPVSLRNGVTLLSNLESVSWGRMDNSMHKLLLSTLQNHFPCRVRNILVINPSFVVSRHVLPV